MTNFIFNAIIWTLALYGFIEIIKTIYYVFTYINMKPNGIYLIIAVKNQEERIEGFLRSMLFRFIYGKEENINDIIVTDLDSNDNTKLILDKLEKDYDCIKVVDWFECKELIDNVEKSSIVKTKGM